MSFESDFDKSVLTQIGGVIESVKSLQKTIDLSREDATERLKSLVEDVQGNKKSFDEFKTAFQNDLIEIKLTILKMQWGFIVFIIFISALTIPTNPLIASTLLKLIAP